MPIPRFSGRFGIDTIFITYSQLEMILCKTHLIALNFPYVCVPKMDITENVYNRECYYQKCTLLRMDKWTCYVTMENTLSTMGRVRLF